MIFYFTGTGNSLYAAKLLDENAVSIPQIIHQDNLHFRAEKIGIVAPVYGHELPDMVTEFIRKTDFDTDYLYCIATYGSGHSGAGAWLEELFRNNGKELNYANVVLMPDNYLPGFDMDHERLRESRLHIEEQLAAIKEDVNQSREYILPASFPERMMHKQAVGLKHKIVTEQFLQNLYSVSDDCVGCGICEKVCPSACFKVSDGKAQQNAKGCQMCMACIHACPHTAIKLNMREPNPGAHYRNSHVSLKEIIESNQQ